MGGFRRFKFGGDHQAPDDMTIFRAPTPAPIRPQDWQQDQPANRSLSPGKIFSYTNILQKADGEQLNVETEEALLYVRSRRVVVDILEMPFNSGLLPRLSIAMNQPPIHVEVLNDDDIASFWISLEGDESSSPPPPNNIPTRLIECIPGTAMFFEYIDPIQLDTVSIRLKANNYPPTGFLCVLAFDTSTTLGRLRAYFQSKAYMTDI